MVTGMAAESAAATTPSRLISSAEGQADLPAAGQLDIELREQLRVEQRAVLDPLRAIDAEAGAERIEAVLGAGEFLAGEGERVDHPRGARPRAVPHWPSS